MLFVERRDSGLKAALPRYLLGAAYQDEKNVGEIDFVRIGHRSIGKTNAAPIRERPRHCKDASGACQPSFVKLATSIRLFKSSCRKAVGREYEFCRVVCIRAGPLGRLAKL